MSTAMTRSETNGEHVAPEVIAALGPRLDTLTHAITQLIDELSKAQDRAGGEHGMAKVPIVDVQAGANGRMPAGRARPVPAARAVGLTKVYGSGQTQVRALDGVHVDFAGGEFVAIMGPSGSGKSTLMHCMAGLDTASGGQAFIGDTEITALSDRDLTRLRRDRIGFIFQAFNLLPTLTAAENITLPGDIAGRRPDQAWLDKVIDTVGLRGRLEHRPGELSGGQQQRVACARALAGRPALIFADEPTGNLDSRAGAELLGFLRRCVDDLGQTLVMVTHDPGAAAYADRVLFLADGAIVDELTDPTAATVLERMTRLDDPNATTRAASTTAPAGARSLGDGTC